MSNKSLFQIKAYIWQLLVINSAFVQYRTQHVNEGGQNITCTFKSSQQFLLLWSENIQIHYTLKNFCCTIVCYHIMTLFIGKLNTDWDFCNEVVSWNGSNRILAHKQPIHFFYSQLFCHIPALLILHVLPGSFGMLLLSHPLPSHLPCFLLVPYSKHGYSVCSYVCMGRGCCECVSVCMCLLYST